MGRAGSLVDAANTESGVAPCNPKRRIRAGADDLGVPGWGKPRPIAAVERIDSELQALRARLAVGKVPLIAIVKLGDALLGGEPFEPASGYPVVGVTPVEGLLVQIAVGEQVAGRT